MRLIKFQELTQGTPVYVNPDYVVCVMHGASFIPPKIQGQPPKQVPGVIIQCSGVNIGVKGAIDDIVEQLNRDWGDVPQ